MYYESHFSFVPFGDSKLVEGCYDVQFSIDLCMAQGIKGFTDQGKEVVILYNNHVKASIILANSHFASPSMAMYIGREICG